MVKQTSLHPYPRIIVIKRINCSYTHNLDKSQGSYAEWKDPILKYNIVYDSISVTFLQQRHYRNGEHVSSYHGLGKGGGVEEGECNGVSTEGQQEGLCGDGLFCVFKVVVDAHTYMCEVV